MTSSPEPFDPVSRVPLSVLVSRQLRDRIVSGDLAVGWQLPSEKALTEQLGVSRSTVREALRILQAQGLLSGGDRVTTTRPHVSDAHTVDSAAMALENVLRLGQVSLLDLVDLRVVLEGAALEHAAVDPGREGLSEAEAALQTMRQALATLDVEAFHTADVAFHIALVSAGGNGASELVLAVLRETIAAHLREALTAIDDPSEVLAVLVAQHAALLSAVKRGDGVAARRQVGEHILGFYTAHGQPVDP
ncbi:MAG TPA: FCD domain-containing protein [Euzebya sp.]|nr:FCD domain-containing protein [Euzebya sp.]